MFPGRVLKLRRRQSNDSMRAGHGAESDRRRSFRHRDGVRGAPLGLLICGTREFAERARGFRRMVGGNMRQAGPIAAAGIVALENMVARLPEDHRTAKRLAVGLNLSGSNSPPLAA